MPRLPPIPSTLFDWLGRQFADRRCILAVGPALAGARWAESLTAVGARPALVLAEPAGGRPTPETTEHVAAIVDVPVAGRPTGVMERLRAYENALRSPAPAVVESIERYDPSREAIVIASHVSDIAGIAGRPRYGARAPAWAALEDKVIIDRLWDDAGIDRAPSRTVSPEPEALLETAQLLDQGAGTVWAGDAREGFHGGATGLRWVRSLEHAAEASRFFAARCDGVRVMPFLEGTPCSIHGVVLPDTVISMRPVEMLTLRRPGRSDLFYAGASTWWDPHPDDRDAMRRIARRVGAVLRRNTAYRGAFTIDGVITVDGFRPTELNARAGAAMRLIARSRPELPLELLLLSIVEDEPLPVEAAALERVVVASADAIRQGGGWCNLYGPVSKADELDVRFDADGRCAPSPRPTDADGRLTVTPGPTGGALRFDPDPERTPTGPPLADRVAAAFALADRVFDAGLGRLTPARLVR